jgi:hypothetical protein
MADDRPGESRVFLFVESLAGLDIATHAPELARRWLVKFVTPSVLVFAEPKFRQIGWVVEVTPTTLRLLKPLLSLLQLPVIQQDPFGWAFRLGLWKQVLSDGLLTEFIVMRLGVRVRRFYSLASVRGGSAEVVPGCAIVGSNWLEFGSMSMASYQDHLAFLARTYPEALYYCHPKERSLLPEQMFGAARVRRPDRPLESLLRAQGIPERIVGVCSSSLLSLPMANRISITVDLVCPALDSFDGKQADSVYQIRRPDGDRDRVCVGDLQQFLVDQLATLGVRVRQVHQTAEVKST